MKRFINEWNNQEFSQILKGHPEIKSIAIAGEGNMNYTLRLLLADGSSLIAKQSPPFCSKFPSIPAPSERIFSELKFFELANTSDYLKNYSPKILQVIKEDNLVIMEDLGSAKDFEFLYEQDPAKDISDDTLKELSLYLKELHSLKVEKKSHFENINMRHLNHAYIFKLPFEAENDAIDLDTVTAGLQAASLKYKEDELLKKAASDLGEIYYKNTNSLIQGDFYPRSWITTPKGLFVIDSEFAFFGVPEFDLSVFLAHMLMCGKFDRTLKVIKKYYGSFDETLTTKLIGVEVFRRIMFVSQLPLKNSLVFKESLMQMSKDAILAGNITHLKDVN